MKIINGVVLMFYIISIIFGILGVVFLYLLKILSVHFSFFHEHQNIFNIIFLMLFVFLYNFCVYDYKPDHELPYVLVNIVYIIVFVLVDKIIYKRRG